MPNLRDEYCEFTFTGRLPNAAFIEWRFYRVTNNLQLCLLQEIKWKRCKRLISGKVKMNRTSALHSNDSGILNQYKPTDDCQKVLQRNFVYPPVTKEEQQLPIAFGFTVHKEARLFERILQAIYMPNNVYCIHIDKKAPDVFRRAIKAMIRCLPNVFISANSTDVVWAHFSVVQAQINCMGELLQSSVKWKYYISLVGQDFPLYDNRQIVAALQSLNNTNSIESFPMPKLNKGRSEFVHILKNRVIYRTRRAKQPLPHNISIYKGSTHIVAIRDFVEFALHSKIGKDFIEFLKDTYVPDETVYASLQQHPLAPGGIRGKQPYYIPRALHWFDRYPECHGTWVRTLCWIAIEDLSWALGSTMKEKLFVHKIPFDFNDDLLECILVARQERKYNTTVWKQDGNQEDISNIKMTENLKVARPNFVRAHH